MKRLLVLLAIVFLVANVTLAEDIPTNFTSDASLAISAIQQPMWTISIIPDGQLEINGKAVDKMSDPEIKETMLKLREWLITQEQDRSLVIHYDRQTGYLLEELEKCLKEKKE